jgi:phytoene dehydrogenase-like protein
VLGAGMSGLLAARVLADAYGQVTVIERDVLTGDGRDLGRRGVPQGRHAHALLPRGGQILDELFPRILAELVAAGAPVIDQLATGADLALPEVPGPRSARFRALNAYLRRLEATAENDARVASQFLRVIGMLDPPSRLFHPAIVLRVLGRSRRRGMEPHRERQFATQPS